MADSDRIARVRGESLCVKVTPDEIAYRKKYLPDPTLLNNDLGKFICTVCNDSLVHVIREGLDLHVHRVLQVLVCEKCFNFYGDGNFSVDEDGDDKYCRWCGQGGQLYMCSACTCAFCQKCIKDNLKASVLVDLEKDDWKCLVCVPRPMFGCRAICWGAQELNKIAKEKTLEKKKKRQEWLENKNKEKLEGEKAGRSSRKTEEDQPKGKKRRKVSSDSSPEVMPAKKPRAGRANGKSRKTRESSSDSESDESSRRLKLRRAKQNRGKREDSSDSSRDKGKERGKKIADTSDDSEKGKPKSKKKVLKNKKDYSSSDSSEDKRKKAKVKNEPDNESNSANKKNEKEKFKLMTDSDASSKSEKPGKNSIVKKKVDMAIVWLQSAVKDIAELGLMIRQRSTKFANKKLNSDCIKTYEDVLSTADKLKSMLTNIHLNYNHLETKLNGQLDGWKSHAGIGENKMEEIKIFTPKDSGDDSDADGATSILVQANNERPTAQQEESNAEVNRVDVEAKSVDNDNKGTVKSGSETDFEVSPVKKDPEGTDEGKQSPTKQLEGNTESQARSCFVTSTPKTSHCKSPGKLKSESLLLKPFSSDEDDESSSFLLKSFAEKMKEKWEDGPAQLSLIAPIFSDSSDNDEEQSNEVVSAKGNSSKITVEVDKQKINTLKSNSKQDIRSSGNQKICDSSLLKSSDTEKKHSNRPEKRKVKETSDSKLGKLNSKLKLNENPEMALKSIKKKCGDLESSSDEESESKYNMKDNDKRKCLSNDNKNTSNSESELSVQAIGALAEENYTKDKSNIKMNAKSKNEGLESLADSESESLDGKTGKQESKFKAIINENEMTRRRDQENIDKSRKGESESSSDEECLGKNIKKGKNKSKSTQKANDSQLKKTRGKKVKAKSLKEHSESSAEESESQEGKKENYKSRSKAKANKSEMKKKQAKGKNANSKKEESESSSDQENEGKDINKYKNSSKSGTKGNAGEIKNNKNQVKIDKSTKEGSDSDEKSHCKNDKNSLKSKVNESEIKHEKSSKIEKRALDPSSSEESERDYGKGENVQGKSEIEENPISAKHKKRLETGSSSKCNKNDSESINEDICSTDNEEDRKSNENSITFNEVDGINMGSQKETEEGVIHNKSDFKECASDKTKDEEAKEETADKWTLDEDNESIKSLEKSHPVVDVSSDESLIKQTKFVGFTSTEDEDDEETKDKDEEKRTKGETKSLKKKSVRNLKLKKNLLDSSGGESSVEDDLGSDKKSKTIKKDEDKDVSLSSAASSDSEIIPVKKTRKTAPSDYNLLDEAENKLKKKRKRVQCADSSDESGSGKEKGKKKATDGESPCKMGRKNIKKIKTKEDLAEATLEAAGEERERRRRIEERQKLFNEVFEVKESKTVDKLVLDFDVEKKEELVSVHQDLVAKMKPHQAKGVQFMWNSCFESISQLKKKKGSGCILAHCMGLGKTFQVVSLIHTLITHEETGVRLVMVVCPLSTVLNWVSEFSKWLADIEGAEDNIEVFHLTRYQKNPDRARELRRWHLNGGVLIIGYEMFRNLSSEVAKKFRPKIRKDFQETLIDPGADLIVCDEGHMLKNEATALSKAMNRVKTLRRIVLTGTPMQNNLVEYHCMVQFVKPNLLGTKREFLNRFVNPITNGQFVDSTDRDVKVMKRRAHVLHKMLEGLVQRFDYNVLTPFLPPKHEYVINVCLSELQVKLYREYLDNHSQQANDKKAGSRLFQDWQALGRVWTHPRVLKMSTDRANLLQEKKMLEMSDDEEGSLKDFIDDDSDTAESTSEESEDSGSGSSGGGKKKKKVSNTRGTRRTRAMASKNLLDSDGEEIEPEVVAEVDIGGQDKGWWSDLVEPEHLDDITLSGKLVLLFAILRECELIQDKVLVFSQSLFSLNLIEYFLDKIDAATQEDRVDPTLGDHQGNWSRGLDYFRLDGSTSSENRSIWCANFNREDNPRARLFLISTRAGGLGINLTAANRVIIFDASWNPSHDVQSIFRIYRFGQKKPCYVYRFIAHGTMEEKVYDRQVSKQSMSNRVVDEMQMHRHFSMNDLTELYSFTPPSDPASRPTPSLPTDRLLAELLREQGKWIEKFHEHDSLLENVVEEELNEEERKLAWEDYENDKKSINTNANAGVNPMTQQIEFIKQQIKAKYPDKTEQEQQQILVYQVSLLMKQQQEQRMKQAQAQAQLQVQYQAQYQAQMASAGVVMSGTRGQAPQMYSGAKPGQAMAGQPQMQPWQVQMQMQYMNQMRRQQQQQQLLRQQQQADQQRTQAIGLMRMQQKLLAQNQENKGVVITELPDEPVNPET